MTINLTLPTSWQQLSQEQLRFVLCGIVAIEDVYANATDGRFIGASPYATIAELCVFRWGGLKLLALSKSGYICALRSDLDNSFTISLEQLTAAADSLSWISLPPSVPVRLDIVDGAKAVAADISDGFSFDDYLSCDTLWQIYLVSNDAKILRKMAGILYRKPDIVISPEESLGVFYWWQGLKTQLSAMFPTFLCRVEVSPENPSISEDELRRAMDTQIRALTKGDICKEAEILALPALRALTELEAQAREYKQIREKYPS